MDKQLIERYQKAYQNKSESQQHFSATLLQLIASKLPSFLKERNNLSCAELGCGDISYILNSDSEMISELKNFRLDLYDIVDTGQRLTKRYGSQHQWTIMQQDLTKKNLPSNNYHFILDAHLLHCLTEAKERDFFLRSVYQSLKKGGVFLGEHMTLTEFSEKNAWIKSHRYIPHAHRLEEELINIGFKIQYFYLPLDTKIILDQHRTTPLKSDPDSLCFIAQKN